MLLTAALLLAASAPIASAATVQFTGQGGYGIYQAWATIPSGVTPAGTYGGGEFTVQAMDFNFNVLSNYAPVTRNQLYQTGGVATTNTFQTFCLEMNEYVSAGGLYTADLSGAAYAGGRGGGSPDPLSVGTAWLYSQFAKGTLQGYAYTSGEPAREASAAALQVAIWYLEEEITGSTATGSYLGSNVYLTLVASQFGSLSNAMANDTSNQYGVRVLNLTAADGRHQDMLVATPIPSAVWLLGAGIVGLVGLRRRSKS
jgi:hypothetical protein